MQATQLTFAWPKNVSMAPGDFFVSPANAEAHAQLMAPASWPRGKLCLTGPEGAGKSHLARVFAQNFGATLMQAPTLTAHTPRPGGATVIEDADRLPPEAEEWLFHQHNALAGRAPLLLTARQEPARWPIRLPDLASRMQGTAVARVKAPDDALLTALMLKLFADRQITPDPRLPDYLLPRMERRFTAVAHMVDMLDVAALATRRPVNKQLAVDLIANRLPGFSHESYEETP